MKKNRENIEQAIKAKIEIWRRRANGGDFKSFLLYWDVKFFSGRDALDEVIETLQYVHDEFKKGNSVRVAISMPPRAGKSYTVSLFCCFMLGLFPDKSIMRNSSTSLLYRKFSRDIGNIINTDKWRNCFGNSIFLKINNSEKLVLDSAKDVSYFGNGVGGNIIGMGASMLAITDDLFSNMTDALSGTYNEKVVSWDDSAMRSRVEGNCCRIDIGTRWTKSDVIGRNEDKYDRIVKVSALDKNGETFCKKVHSTDFYLKEKSEIDPMTWSAEYMQEPIDIKGQLFKYDELMYYDEEPEEYEANLALCDSADTGTDYLSSPMVKKIGDLYYLYDVIFTQLNMEFTEPLIAGAYNENHVDIARFESNNGGKLFAKSIQKKVNNTEIYWKATTSNKETRISTDSFWIKKHIVFKRKYKEGSDYALFMKQLTSYVKGKTGQHDDAPDSLSMLRRLIAEIYETRELIREEDRWESTKITDVSQIRL